MDAATFRRHISEHSWSLYTGLGSEEKLFSTMEGLDMETQNGNTKQRPLPKHVGLKTKPAIRKARAWTLPPPHHYVASFRLFFTDTEYHHL